MRPYVRSWGELLGPYRDGDQLGFTPDDRPAILRPHGESWRVLWEFGPGAGWEGVRLVFEHWRRESGG